MCGIIGYIGDDEAVPYIIEGLKRLEYRGYDSAGIAVLQKKNISVIKKKGRLTILEDELKVNPLKGSIAIGHTRWATHGEPSNINSHPHMGSKSNIAVVHNGIIENYKALRTMLEGKGVKFVSDTDSEVIAQLAEYYHQGDIMETVVKVIAMLEGSYALGIISTDVPDKIIAVKKDNPLIIGLGKKENFIASDIPAVLKHTDKVIYLEDKEIAVLSKNKVEVFNTEKDVLDKQVETIKWNAESAEKGGYEHFMFKEIMEQPRVIKDTIASVFTSTQSNYQVIDSVDITKYNRIVVSACGSAFNAGVVGKYVFERLLRLPVEVDLASEFRYKDPLVDEKTLVILISQSGETADTIAAMREAKRKGAKTLAVVNVIGSTIAREADYVVYTVAGPEIAVATTKAFSAQLIILYVLAVRFAVKADKLKKEKEQELLKKIESLPKLTEEIFKQTSMIQHYAAECFNSKSIFFIGRNIDYAIALEGSLKLKEISYIHSEAYAGGELKHGTISLIEDNTLVVAISSCPKLYGKIFSNIEQVVSRGAKVLLITSSELKEKTEQNSRLTVLETGETEELFSPSLSVILLQLLSYYVAANKGCDIDKPRNLAKSVTVE